MGSLENDWLAVEVAEIDSDMDGWNEGLKASFRSLFSALDTTFEVEADVDAPEPVRN